MSEPDTRQILRSAPYFPVPDVERSVVHYERVFGFRREYVAGTEFGIVSENRLNRLPVGWTAVAGARLGSTPAAVRQITVLERVR